MLPHPRSRPPPTPYPFEKTLFTTPFHFLCSTTLSPRARGNRTPRIFQLPLRGPNLNKMAQPKHTTQRRNLAPPPLPEPKISMDPTNKKHPKSNLSTTSTIKPHSTTPPDPTVPPRPSTIQNISNHFVTLYANHKILASLKGSNGLSNSHSHCQHHPQTIDKHLQAKGLANSTVLDTSCIALTKSSSQHGGRNVADVHKESTRIRVKEKDKKSITNKKSHQQEELDVEKELARQKFELVEKKSSSLKEGFNREGKDVKKAAALMAKSVESDELKRFNEGCEMKRPSISLAINGGGRRKSFCCSQTELADFFSCTGVKVVAVDMPPFMQIHAVDCARKAHDSLEKFTSKTLALTLKKEFDGVYGPAWHCIVGTSFGSFVTHSVGGFMYFSMDHKIYILLFKTTVQRAD